MLHQSTVNKPTFCAHIDVHVDSWIHHLEICSICIQSQLCLHRLGVFAATLNEIMGQMKWDLLNVVELTLYAHICQRLGCIAPSPRK